MFLHVHWLGFFVSEGAPGGTAPACPVASRQLVRWLWGTLRFRVGGVCDVAPARDVGYFAFAVLVHCAVDPGFAVLRCSESVRVHSIC